MSSKKGNKTMKGLEHKSDGGAAEGTGSVQSGEEDAQGKPYHSLQLSERRLWQGWDQPLLPGN